jgi:hypothetical protein
VKGRSVLSHSVTVKGLQEAKDVHSTIVPECG